MFLCYNNENQKSCAGHGKDPRNKGGVQMKNKKLLTLLTVFALVLAVTACQTVQEAPEKPEPQTPEKPVPEETVVPPSPAVPVSPVMPEPMTKPAEQAHGTEADQIIERLRDNLHYPTTAVIRTQGQDSQTKINITPELLEELAGFLCNNYTVVKTPMEGGADLESRASIYVAGEENASFVQIFWQLDENDEREMVAWIQEEDTVAQYRYDYSTYRALLEVLAENQYANTVELEGKFQYIRSAYELDELNPKTYNIHHALQFEDQLLYCLSASDGENMNYFEAVSTETGKSLYTFPFKGEIMDIRKTSLDNYDYCIITKDMIAYRSSKNQKVELDFTLPKAVSSNLYKGMEGQKLFDLDYINDELVYISNEGVVLSNKSGKRQDLLLSHDRLYEALELINDGDREFAPRYAAPKLLYNGKYLVCPILVPGSQDGWAGMTLFNLANGTYEDYIGSFEPMIQDFAYPDDETIVVKSAGGFSRMELPLKTIVSYGDETGTNEVQYSFDSERFVIYTTDMNYNGKMYVWNEETPQTHRMLLDVKGDYFTILDVTEDYILCGFSDSYGSCLLMVPYV